MVTGVVGAMMTTLWSVMIISFICMVTGVFLVEGVLSFCIRHGSFTDDANAQLRHDFGNPRDAMLSLYKAMSGGQDWGELYSVVYPMGFLYRMAFLLFQVISFIALLNVVAAVFVESALERSKNDRSFKVHTAMKANQEFLTTMKNIFRRIDTNQCGTISLIELKENLRDKEVGAYFESLGIDANQATNLFHLLDSDGNGSIDEKEFMFGCIKIKGEAKSLDIAILHEEMKSLRSFIHDGFNILHEQMTSGPDGCMTQAFSVASRSLSRGFSEVNSTESDLSSSGIRKDVRDSISMPLS